MWTSANFAVGDKFACVYNNKGRANCEVLEKPYMEDWMVVMTDDGIRRFKYHKIYRMVTKSLAPT